jgi:hypothetical protein
MQHVAFKKYDTITALSADKRREDYRADIPAMVKTGLDALRPYGVPTECQKFIEWKPDGLKYPIVGYLDYHWANHNITIDLKTSDKMPSAVKIAHARQVALYVTSNNADARACYVTPKKQATYQIENTNDHRNALYKMALRCEAFLSLSDDPTVFRQHHRAGPGVLLLVQPLRASVGIRDLGHLTPIGTPSA